ncbi:MAG TPA: DNA polymerase III subunit delta [Burkholderiales bacterium]|nr:DNA polymerase III subunit delta [Burkholderiales bacterium]
MQIRSGELNGQLAKSLAPAYAIHGDEPLIALEAADAVRAAARARGFTERVVLEPGRHFDWSELAHAAASLSLFGGRKLIELRLPTGKPGTPGAAAIAAYLQRPGADTLLLVTLPRLDRQGQAAAWFAALAAKGVVVEVWPLERQRLPGWIGERLARQGQRASREVLEFLAEHVEGNLLAAHQEVQKLALLAPPGELSLDVVEAAIVNVARYDPYDAAEALVSGDTGRYLRVLEGLRGEGEQPTFVLFVLSNALFALQSLHRGAEPRVFNRALQRALPLAARRYAERLVDDAIAQCAQIDRAIKGVGSGDAWERFAVLALRLHLQ